MLRIDSHQHFWVYKPERDTWISDQESILKDDFMPEHLLPILMHYGFEGCVVVQSDQSEEETLFQLKNAEQHSFIKGVVGWVDLQAEDLEGILDGYQKYDKLKGFRHILQGEQDRALMLRPAFKKGIELLGKHGYSYDLLVLPDQLDYAETLVAEFPDQAFVLDHLGKPEIKSGNINDWSRSIKTLAKHENVYCKASGVVTEADLSNWKAEDFKAYLDVMFEAFGTGRVMFGSDWPVCRLAATYGQVTGLMEDYTSSFSKQEQEQFWSGNAVRFYKL